MSDGIDCEGCGQVFNIYEILIIEELAEAYCEGCVAEMVMYCREVGQ